MTTAEKKVDPQVELHAAGIARAADMFGVAVKTAAKSEIYMRAVGLPTKHPKGAVPRAVDLYAGEPLDKESLILACREERSKMIDDSAVQNVGNGHERASSKVFDEHSVTSVLRWMGANGWTDYKAAAQAIEKLTGCDNYSMTTVRLQVKAGRDGKRGTPAELTDDQASQVRVAGGLEEEAPKPKRKPRRKAKGKGKAKAKTEAAEALGLEEASA